MGPFTTVTYGSQNYKISSWYNDEATFIIDFDPYLARGGTFVYGVVPGMFSFADTHGMNQNGATFRIVLNV